MKYKVIDEMCCAVTYFDNSTEANKHAFNVQGVLIRVEDEKILKDYTC